MKTVRHTVMKTDDYTMHATQVLREFEVNKDQLATDMAGFKTTGLRYLSNKGGAWFQPIQINARYEKKPLLKSVAGVIPDLVDADSIVGGTGLVKDLEV